MVELRNIKIKVADTVIGINTLFNRSYEMCSGFITDETPVFTVQCSYEDLDLEKEIFESEYRIKAPGDIQLEVFSLLHKIADQLIDYNTILFHGATIALNNNAFIFTAPSGTGKTTHIMKWLSNVTDTIVINGDKPFIKFPEGKSTAVACGSPWAGKENMYSNITAPLKAIIFIERNEYNHIERISFADAFPTLLLQTYYPNDTQKKIKILKLLQKLNSSVSFWRFQCNNFREDCFDVAYNALVNDKS